jgi:hypothetical protein
MKGGTVYYVFLILSLLSIVTMSFALYRAIKLGKRIPGGVMKTTLNLLTKLIVLFTIGYLVAPFFFTLPQFSTYTVVGILFFAVSVFVVIVIDLFYIIVTDVGL